MRPETAAAIERHRLALIPDHYGRWLAGQFFGGAYIDLDNGIIDGRIHDNSLGVQSVGDSIDAAVAVWCKANDEEEALSPHNYPLGIGELRFFNRTWKDSQAEYHQMEVDYGRRHGLPVPLDQSPWQSWTVRIEIGSVPPQARMRKLNLRAGDGVVVRTRDAAGNETNLILAIACSQTGAVLLSTTSEFSLREGWGFRADGLKEITTEPEAS